MLDKTLRGGVTNIKILCRRSFHIPIDRFPHGVSNLADFLHDCPMYGVRKNYIALSQRICDKFCEKIKIQRSIKTACMLFKKRKKAIFFMTTIG
jgi:hypothetical protein